jgi:hypothetical protein
MYNCKEAIEPQQIGDESRILYIAQGSPLGSPDRDVIIKAIINPSLPHHLY